MLKKYKQTEEHKKKTRTTGKRWKVKDTSKMGKKGYMNGFKKGNHTKTEFRNGHAPTYWKDGISKSERQEKIAGRARPLSCEICREFERRRNTRLCFDHDHSTGEFRGWLCSRCNSVLGYVNDDINLLEALTKYLIRNNKML